MTGLLVPVVVLAIIAIQIYFFVKNVSKMNEYKDIFGKENTWGIDHNPDTDFVSGISGEGNKVFVSVKDSINKYLSNNSGSVIDFSLLKDAVDRHCDSVENEINTLTPVPLYCGLAGTMAGVIIGLGSLLETGSITALLSSGSGNFGAAANGVNDLLSGVAWAMIASICGIFLTTLCSLLFKRNKLQFESGKNTFLAWLQARLLPELPSDTSDALNRLVINLNKFNNTFASNTSELRGALTQVNESYRIQGDIIQAVHDMDVMKMAEANVRVLGELKECTDKLEAFNQYLNDIHGYTDAILRFTSQFESEANRLYVLEEIKEFFTRHKAEIAKDSADVDLALRTSLSAIKDTASNNARELNSTLVKQAEEFKNILREEKDSFEKINSDIKTQFEVRISQIPMLEKRLSEISEIPKKLDKLIEKIEHSNSSLASNVKAAISQSPQHYDSNGKSYIIGGSSSFPSFPSWMKWIIMVSVLLIAIACVSLAVYNIWLSPKESLPEQVKCDFVDTVDTVYVKETELIPECSDSMNVHDLSIMEDDSEDFYNRKNNNSSYERKTEKENLDRPRKERGRNASHENEKVMMESDIHYGSF